MRKIDLSKIKVTGVANNSVLVYNNVSSSWVASNTVAANVDWSYIGNIPYANSSANGVVKIVDSTANTSNSIAASANSVKVAFDAALANGATAYANGVTYTNSATATGYANAVAYANTIAGTAYTNAVTQATTLASAAYTNAVAYAAANTYVNTQLGLKANLTGAAFTGAVSGITTLAAGNTTITGFANVSTTLQVTGAVTFSNTLSVTGNITGSSANVTIVAGAYTTTFANTGAVSFPATASFTGNVALSGGTITTAPSGQYDIVNKLYADSIVNGVNYHAAVRLTQTTTFDATTATYNNGTSGVGATITKTSPFSALSLDGVSAAYGDRILMRSVSNTAWNGVYTVSNTGSASYAWVMTRATDYDTTGSGTNEIDIGDLIYVTAGSTLAGSSWVQQSTVATIGTDAITFAQFGSKTLYTLTGGSGLYYSTGSAFDGSANSTIAVNTAYIATLSANNTTYLNGQLASFYAANSQLASYTLLTGTSALSVSNTLAAGNTTITGFANVSANLNTSGTLSANVITVTGNVTTTQTNLQVDAAGTATAMAIVFGG